MTVGIIYNPIYLKHDTGDHVENAGRLEAIIDCLEKAGLKSRLINISPRQATVEEVASVHQKNYISYVREVAQGGGGWLDADTVTSPDSYKVALYAAGGVIAATDAVMNGEVGSAFALVRPPGHHAVTGQAMGFCLFNNIAIAAKQALANHKLERILIIDFDVHHGNGTQGAFYDDPRVLYISTHQYPFYPGTGTVDETGAGEGKGTNINIPLPMGCGDTEYTAVFEQIIVPVSRRFKPQLIMVSAGYDPHWSDQIGAMQVTVKGFAKMTEIIRGLADELCSNRTVFALEGGYNLQALAYSVKAAFETLLGNKKIDDPLGQPPRKTAAPDIISLVKEIKEIYRLS